MEYLKGIVTNIQTHTNTHSISNDNKEKTRTIFCHTFILERRAMRFDFNKPVTIYDGDICAVAFMCKRDGGRVHALMNHSNQSYYGLEKLILLVLMPVALFIAVVALHVTTLPNFDRIDFSQIKLVTEIVMLFLAGASIAKGMRERTIEQTLRLM
jgi:hypothetical protein